MNKRSSKYQLRALGLAILMGLSIASFAYLNSVNQQLSTPAAPYSEEFDKEKEELLPDVQIIKLLMNKTLEFVTHVRRI